VSEDRSAGRRSELDRELPDAPRRPFHQNLAPEQETTFA
jgi:hypothetical protein